MIADSNDIDLILELRVDAQVFRTQMAEADNSDIKFGHRCLVDVAKLEGYGSPL